MASDIGQPSSRVVGTSDLSSPRSEFDGDGPADTGLLPGVDIDVEQSDYDIKVTRRVHIVLGIVVAVLGAWMLHRSVTELPFRGANDEPGPGYLPVLLTICLTALGLLLAATSAFGQRSRHGEVPTLTFGRHEIGRALLVWVALAVCTALLNPLGFLVAGEALVLLVIVVVERMRSIPQVITLLLLPPAMYLLFGTLLEVRLPGGTLWG